MLVLLGHHPEVEVLPLLQCVYVCSKEARREDNHKALVFRMVSEREEGFQQGLVAL